MGPCDYSSLQPPPAAASPMITHKYLHNTRQQPPALHEPSFSASDSISRRHPSFWAFISIIHRMNLLVHDTFTKCVVSVQTYFYKEHSTQVEMNGQFVYNDTDDYRGCQPATDRTSTALTGLWTPFIHPDLCHSFSPFVLLIAQT